MHCEIKPKDAICETIKTFSSKQKSKKKFKQGKLPLIKKSKRKKKKIIFKFNIKYNIDINKKIFIK